jgi:hypothetical protein
MGVKVLLPHLHGGKDYKAGFLNINSKGERIGLDAAGLLWYCAKANEDTYVDGNYASTIKLFAR